MRSLKSVLVKGKKDWIKGLLLYNMKNLRLQEEHPKKLGLSWVFGVF